MKLLFRLFLLLSLVQLNEYSLCAYSCGDATSQALHGLAALCNGGYVKQHFCSARPVARTANRKLKATFNEEDDDNKSLRLKKEKDQNGQYLSVNNAPAHSLIACSGRSLPLTHLSYRKCYSPSCKMHVLFQVFRI